MPIIVNDKFEWKNPFETSQKPDNAQPEAPPPREERPTPPAAADSGQVSAPPSVDGSPFDSILQPEAASDAPGPTGYVSVANAGKGWTEVVGSDGRSIVRKGTRAWRNNNPGNIEYGSFAKKLGAIGSDGRFAVFPTYEDGRRAKETLLFEGKGYRDKTIYGAISRYAPPSENNANAYASAIAQAAGVSVDTPLSDPSKTQRSAMLDAMERVEGFRSGREYAGGSSRPLPDSPALTAFAESDELRPFHSGEKRPNADGSYSTEIGTTWEMPDGKWVNVPSLWMGKDGPQQFKADDEEGILGAMQKYEGKHGLTFARFNSEEEAVTAAETRSAAGGASAGPATKNGIVVDENYQPPGGGPNPFADIIAQQKAEREQRENQIADQFEQSRNQALAERHNSQIEGAASGNWEALDPQEAQNRQQGW